jgi:hypothetical protein
MTSGSSGSNAGFYPSFSGGSTSYKVWSGGDGKYTTFAGTQRTKWNDYSVTACTRDRQSREFILLRKWNDQWPNPTNVYQDTRTVSAGVAQNGFGQQLEFDSNDQIVLLNKLTSKVKSHDFNLAVNLGQMGQLTRMIDDNLRRFGRAALHLKRGNFAAAARQLGVSRRSTRLKPSDVSGRWLEMEYGWRPAISDAFEASKAFEAISNGPRSQTYRVSRKKTGQFEGSQSPSLYSSKYNETLRRQIIYETVEEMSVPRQLGLLDPLSVAWELLPWSFVVDWFIPIGAYLDALNQVPALRGRFLTTTVRRQDGFTQCTWTGDLGMGLNYDSVNPHDVAVLKSPPNDRWKYTRLVRQYSETLQVPLPSPHLGGSVHGRRVWNAIALAQQRFSR